MNERQLEKLEEIKNWLSHTLGNYSYTDKYSIETKDEDDYTEVNVKVIISVYNKELMNWEDKEIHIQFEIDEEEIRLYSYEDSYDIVDYSNYEVLIWRKMFFEK
jgi:hypothetical protein